MTKIQHATRMGLLMAVAAALLGWVLRHKETSFADGLRYIHQAEKIEAATGVTAWSRVSTTRSTHS